MLTLQQLCVCVVVLLKVISSVYLRVLNRVQTEQPRPAGGFHKYPSVFAACVTSDCLLVCLVCCCVAAGQMSLKLLFIVIEVSPAV